MIELLINTLEPMGYPIRLQGSLLPDEAYPDAFFTFWNNETSDSSFYDNNETRIIWRYSLNFYSSNPILVNSELARAKTLLKEVGFIVDGMGFDVPSGVNTHTGRSIDLIYIQEAK